MPRNRLPRVMRRYCPTGRRNHGRTLKRLLDTWDWNVSASGPTPWKIHDDDDDDDDDNTCQLPKSYRRGQYRKPSAVWTEDVSRIYLNPWCLWNNPAIHKLGTNLTAEGCPCFFFGQRAPTVNFGLCQGPHIQSGPKLGIQCVVYSIASSVYLLFAHSVWRSQWFVYLICITVQYLHYKYCLQLWPQVVFHNAWSRMLVSLVPRHARVLGLQSAVCYATPCRLTARRRAQKSPVYFSFHLFFRTITGGKDKDKIFYFTSRNRSGLDMAVNCPLESIPWSYNSVRRKLVQFCRWNLVGGDWTKAKWPAWNM